MDQDELVSTFCGIADCDPERAKFFLAASNWELESALNTFLDPSGMDAQDEVQEIPVPPTTTASQPPVTTGTSTGSQPPTLREIASGGQPSSRDPPRFGTIASLNTGDDDSSDDETNKHYAGGSEHSGQLIKGNKDKIKVTDVFNSAKEHGAEVVEDQGKPSRGQNFGAFGGGGFKLGDSSSTSEPIPSARRAAPAQEQTSTITFWKGGFTVDDGPLRKMEDPANKEFLSAVMRGEIPQELVRQAQGAEVHVNMVDKRTEEFVPPKPILRPFSGSGFKLGSPVPEVVTNSGPSPRAPTNPPTAASVDVDQSAPVTSIQIRLSDGTRLVSKFNHTHTVGDIRNFINLSRPGAPTAYALMTTFPNKVLSEEGSSIADAGLLNACIVQRKS